MSCNGERKHLHTPWSKRAGAKNKAFCMALDPYACIVVVKLIGMLFRVPLT